MKRSLFFKTMVVLMAVCVLFTAAAGTAFATEPAGGTEPDPISGEVSGDVLPTGNELTNGDTQSGGDDGQDLTQPPGQDTEDPGDDNEPEPAESLAAPANFTAEIRDYHTVILKWDPVDGAEGYYVYDGQKDPCAIIEVNEAETGKISYTYDKAVPGENMTFKVCAYRTTEEGKKQEGNYSEEVTVVTGLNTPGLTAAVRDCHTVVLTWGKIDGAAGYEVSCGGAYINVGNVLSYTFTGAVPAAAVSYKVRAYYRAADGKITAYSKDSAVRSVRTAIGTPAVTSAAASSSKNLKATWSTIAGASGYEVFVNGKSVGTTTAASYTYTTNSKKVKLTWGKTYKVQVRAYCTVNGRTYYGAKSAARSMTMKPQAPVLNSVKGTNYTSVKVSWSKVSGASGYYVYRKIGSGKYKKLATVKSSKLSYTDKKATLSKKYKYKVRAYWKSGSKIQTGSYSAEKASAAKLGTPALSKPASSAGYIKVKWKKVSGATGYYVYRRLPTGSWKKIATVKGQKSVSYKDTKVSKDTTYIYTVKAYRKSGKKTYKSDYDKTGKTARIQYTMKQKKVTDKKSILYGKTIRYYVAPDGSVVQNAESLVGKQSSYYLYVNKAKNQVTVYAKDGSVFIPVKSFVCSVGKSGTGTPSGTFHTQAKYRWNELMGPSWGQWCTRIHGGVLFHSVYYNSPYNNNRLDVAAYNNLGKAASHGCVRLTAGDAKWIYDNCKVGTTVVIYSKSGYEPLKKPSAKKLSRGHTWDPTDPNMKSKCKKRGCH